MVKIEGRSNPDFAQYVVVLIEEHDPEVWSFQGTSLTKDALEELFAS